MSDQPPSHEDIEKYNRELPKSIIARLPKCEETQRAARLIDEAADLAHRVREQAPRP